MRFAFCNEGFGERPWGEVCEVLARAGYDGVEIAPFTFARDVRELSAGHRAEIRRVAERAGLRVAGLHWLLSSPEGLHIAHPEPGVRERTVAYLCALADFCADLGGEVMVFGSPRQREPIEGVAPEQAWRWAVETFQRVVPALERRQVTLCLEPLTRAETTFVTSAAEARRLIGEVGSPWFRLMLDVKAMCSESAAPAELIRAHRDLLAHVHANDANRQAPGFGDTDFGPILRALQEVGYRGWVSVEPFEFTCDPAEAARRALGYLKALR